MCRYACQVRCQKHRQVTWAFFLLVYLHAALSFSLFQEIIAELQTMVRALLIEYKEKTHSQPTRIIFYRDGVSEGQFQQVHAVVSCLADCYQTLYYTIQVLEEELRAIQLACSSLNKSYRPGITMIIVQKRHHTRLFPVNDRDRVCDLNKHM